MGILIDPNNICRLISPHEDIAEPISNATPLRRVALTKTSSAEFVW